MCFKHCAHFVFLRRVNVYSLDSHPEHPYKWLLYHSDKILSSSPYLSVSVGIKEKSQKLTASTQENMETSYRSRPGLSCCEKTVSHVLMQANFMTYHCTCLNTNSLYSLTLVRGVALCRGALLLCHCLLPLTTENLRPGLTQKGALCQGGGSLFTSTSHQSSPALLGSTVHAGC